MLRKRRCLKGDSRREELVRREDFGDCQLGMTGVMGRSEDPWEILGGGSKCDILLPKRTVAGRRITDF